MQVLCKSSNHGAAISCSVCGQGFAIYWERQSKQERAAAMQEIAKALRSHHSRQAGPAAHPERGFLVPERTAQQEFSGASVLGHAPSWAL